MSDRLLRLSPDPETCPLDQLPPGVSASVVCLAHAAAQAGRLLDIGFVAGTPVQVVRWAPCGDPVQISVLGCHVALRRADAAGVLVRREAA